jgi:subtilisin-like proprotein convertase family protein
LDDALAIANVGGVTSVFAMLPVPEAVDMVAPDAEVRLTVIVNVDVTIPSTIVGTVMVLLFSPVANDNVPDEDV